MRKHRIFSRRKFLKGAALGAAAVTIQPILCTRPLYAAGVGIPGRFVVVINQFGGNDGLNTCVPTTLQSYIDRRPDINLVEPGQLPAGESLQTLNGDFSLHYSLQNMKSIWDDNHMHVVQKVSYPSPNQSHFTSMDIMAYGVRNNQADGDGRGWLGRFADIYCATPVEPLGVIAVGVGKRRDFESDVTDPLILNNVDNFQIQVDQEAGQDGLLRKLVVENTLANETPPVIDPALTIFNTNTQAYELVDRVRTETAGWEPPGEGGNPGTAYPGTSLGRNMRTVSQLLHAQASFGTKVFYTGIGGFDTHSVQHTPAGNSRHENLMEQIDGAVGAFHDDMTAKGLWNNCIVIVISEFGRRNFQNGSVGTDHGWGNCYFVAGGRVKGENVAGGITGTISDSDIADNNQLPWQYDFRDLYVNVMENHLGVTNPAQLFAASAGGPDPNYIPAPNDLDLVF